MRFLVYLGSHNYSIADTIVEGFNQEIEDYLYSRFGD